MGEANPILRDSAAPVADREVTRWRDLSLAQWRSGWAAWLGWMFDGLDMHLYTLVARELGINGGGRKIAKEIYDEFGFHHRWELFPDARTILKELKTLGLKTGIISNWDSRLADLCSGIGITKHLDFVMSSATVGRMKPQPDIFHMALRRAGVKPGEALHVGDHYYADVLGARSVGITPILIHRTENTLKTDCHTISDLRALLDIVG